MDVFDQCAVYVNGQLDALAVEVTVGVQDSDEVKTFLGAGSQKTVALSPGGRYLSIQWSSAVPQTGHNLRLWRKFIDAEAVTVRVVQQGGGLSITSTGYLQAPSISAGVGRNQTHSNAFIGELAEWV